MKGRLLSYEEILKLKDWTKVWVEYDKEKFDTVDGVETVLGNKIINLEDDPCDRDLMLAWFKEGSLKIYEYIEYEQTITKKSTTKTYKGSEILAMIEDGRLRREDILILANTNTEFHVAKIIDGYYGCEVLLKNKFIVKKKLVDFMTAYNSHKKVKPVKGEYIFSDMKDYLEVIYKSSQGTADFLINGQWEIEY